MSRDLVAAEARRQFSEGAHYIKRGYGHRFNAQGQRVDDVVPGREAAVQFVLTGGGSSGVPDYVRFAAKSEHNGRPSAQDAVTSFPKTPLRPAIPPTQPIWHPLSSISGGALGTTPMLPSGYSGNAALGSDTSIASAS
jgi:hypothetical protein